MMTLTSYTKLVIAIFMFGRHQGIAKLVRKYMEYNRTICSQSPSFWRTRRTSHTYTRIDSYKKLAYHAAFPSAKTHTQHLDMINQSGVFPKTRMLRGLCHWGLTSVNLEFDFVFLIDKTTNGTPKFCTWQTESLNISSN